MKLFLTLCLAAISALVAATDLGGGPLPSAGPAGPIATQTRGEDIPPLGRDLLQDGDVPIISPSIVDEKVPKRPLPKIPEGTTIFDHRTTLRRGPGGKWWTIDDPRVERLYLLPCELLATAEDVCRERPAAELAISGEVYHYCGNYYLMLRRVLEVQPTTPASLDRHQAGQTATQPASADRKGAASATTTKSPDGGPSAEDVATALLDPVGGRPVVAPTQPLGRAQVVSSVAPPGVPLPTGPGRMVVNRLARLRTKAGGWALLAFESDNTLREPPLPVLPNEHLQKMEQLSAAAAVGAIFHVSGEIHQYRGRQFLLLRNVIRKRNLDQF